ncbi:sulfite exporter TauE/SafE family protein [Mycobacterium intracellulare]|uniref:sulfite exporter TauE/SafE family protein n=1 Tax=Mycobacterium intracellulare TaxID=1767 RepID=UPI001CDA3EA5|nr:sulfite exporter TauE/SafE family protein [Mycobacterium intracellulare]MCA2251373.1 sulfite exporter TauE/SafE family protein [Mycobacterium intracellulare]
MSATIIIAVISGVLLGLCLGTLGGGGSILAVPILVSALGVGPRPATSASLIIVGLTSAVAAIAHARGGRVRWKAATAFGVIGSTTAFAGSVLNRAVDPQILMIAFSVLMVAAAIGMLRRTTQPEQQQDLAAADAHHTACAPTTPPAAAPATRPRTHVAWAAKFVATALAVGFLTGFLGVGGGFLIVPALVLAMDYSMPIAVGTSLVIIAITSAAAFAARLPAAHIPWTLVASFTAAAIAGSLSGTAISERISGAKLTRSFAVALIAVAVYVALTAGLHLVHEHPPSP